MSWLVDLSCLGACLDSLLFLRASADASLTADDDLREMREVSLGFRESRTDTIVFTPASSGYYGLCTSTECFANSVVRIIINNPNDQDDADGVAAAADVDDDGDGLIEIGTADELNNIRYVLDGSGYQAGAVATKDVTGCPAAGCSGYELTGDIDLASYGRSYDNGAGWEPVGESSAPFTAVFAGNDFPIQELYINRSTTNNVGFFGVLGGRALVHSVSLATIDITGSSDVGGLAGLVQSGGTIVSSAVTGRVVGIEEAAGGLVGLGEGATITASSAAVTVSGSDEIGGLVGRANSATITSSYATGSVSGSNGVGGLVGDANTATITASYAMGTVSGSGVIGGLVGVGNFVSITASYATGDVSGDNDVGGLVGDANTATITASYWDSDVSGITSGFGSPQTTVALQLPTRATGIYADWNGTCSNDETMDSWDFGEIYQYPALTCPPGGVAVQDVQRTLPAFVGFAPEDLSNPTVDSFTVDGVNMTVSAVSAARDGAALRLMASLSCAGPAPCLPVQVDYYVSADDLINTADTLVGTTFVPFTRGGGTTVAVTNATMNATDGFSRYYGACVGDVCIAATELLLQTDTEVLAVRPDGPAVRISQDGDEVTWLVDPSSCSLMCRISLSVYGSQDDGLDVSDDEKIEEQNISLDSGERGTVMIVFTPASTGYYGLCTPTECIASSVVHILINNPNDQDDEDGVAAAADVDDDGDGLIEIATADELNNTRFVMDGSGYQAGAVATKDVTGCPVAGCVGYELTADIDLASYDNGLGWLPVGTSAAPFRAIFYGDDFPIHNLTINRPSGLRVGFFGVLGGRALVHSVVLAAIEVTGGTDVGGLAGLVQSGGTILSSAVTGRVVSTSNQATSSTGGLVGDGRRAFITASSAAGTINGVANVGGLVGDGQHTRITASSAAGTVNGGVNVGGLVGIGSDATIIASSAAGNVSGVNQLGGLVGTAFRATITASYATGDVSGGGNSVGGLLGQGPSTLITASYAAGTVSGQDSVGGLVGFGLTLGGERVNVIASYWDRNLTGGVSDFGEPQTTTALQSPTGATGIYATWTGICPNDPSMDTWDFGTATQYPALNCTPDVAAGHSSHLAGSDGGFPQLRHPSVSFLGCRRRLSLFLLLPPRTWQEAMEDFLN